MHAIANEVIFPPLLGKRMQLSFVVPDLHEAIRFWTEKLGVGPFVVFENWGGRQFIHRGHLSPVEIEIAFAYLGDTQIEIIAQSNLAPSPYTEFLESGGQGLHHIGFWPDDWERSCRELADIGFEEVCVIQNADGGNKVLYFSGPSHLGVMIEVAPMNSDRAENFARIKALADNWDGSRPVRTFRSRADFLSSCE